jgi:hypothetical protein
VMRKGKWERFHRWNEWFIHGMNIWVFLGFKISMIILYRLAPCCRPGLSSGWLLVFKGATKR